MSSQLSRGFGHRARELRATGAQLAPSRVPIESPWRGYQPDIVANERDHNALIACVGLVPSGGWLTTDAGWEQLDSANLPLGRDDTDFVFYDTITSSGTEDGGGGSPTSTVTDSTQAWVIDTYNTGFTLIWTGGVNAGSISDITDTTATTLVLADSFVISDGDTFDIVAVGDAYGQGAVGVAAGNAQPVVGIANFNRVNLVTGLFATEVMAITATGASGGAGTYAETGHLFRKTEVGNWVSVEFTSTDGAATPAVVAGAVPMAADLNNLPDIAIYQPGVTGVENFETLYDIEEVPESVMVWCNGAGNDQIMYYPNTDTSSGASTQSYTDFKSYLKQLDNAADNATYGVRPEWVAMSAQSCESWDNRMFYLNVVQDAVHYSTRLVWSIAGNPFIVDRSFEADDTTNSFVGIGAGFIELEQFTTEGLRVEEMGDVLACYTKDGVALIRRKTVLVSDPYVETYMTKDRGLVGTHALVNLGGGAHFGVFNDGWWIVTKDGFKEVGRIGDESSLARAFSREVEQRILYKWKRDFYRRLNQEKVHLLTMDYDPLNRVVRISAPMDDSDTPNEVWIYEIESDRVFLDDYTNTGGNDESALCWGNIIRTNQTASAWTDVSGSWTAAAGTSWSSYGASFADRASAHGDSRGYVYVHDFGEDLRDGAAPVWSMQTGPHHLGALSTIKTIEALWVEYENRSSQIAHMVAVVTSEERGGSALVPLDEGSEGSIQVAKSHYRVSGHHYQLTLGGTGKPMLGAMSLQVYVDRPEPGVEAIGTES